MLGNCMGFELVCTWDLHVCRTNLRPSCCMCLTRDNIFVESTKRQRWQNLSDNRRASDLYSRRHESQTFLARSHNSGCGQSWLLSHTTSSVVTPVI